MIKCFNDGTASDSGTIGNKYIVMTWNRLSFKFIEYVLYYCRRKNATSESKEQIVTDKEEGKNPVDIKPPSFSTE